MKYKTDYRVIIIALMVLFTVSCEKDSVKSDYPLTARITGFDPNCSTCILEFPDDSVRVRREIGRSPGNRYEAINLDKGYYEIGQLLKVRIKKAEAGEMTPCVSMYPSNGFEDVFVTEFEDFNNLVFKDTVELSYGSCLYNQEGQFYICFDSVIGDSRCPEGAMCFWAGVANVRFKYEKLNSKPVFFDLYTMGGSPRDSIVDGYKFSFIDLKPYPKISNRTEKISYKAYITVNR